MVVQEQMERITTEVMENLKLKVEDASTAKRYVKRAVNKILIYCNRDDLPEQLEDTASQIAEDMLKADMVKVPEKEVASINRGDTAISYKDNSQTRQQTVGFMKNHESTLNRFRKMNLPKDKPDD